VTADNFFFYPPYPPQILYVLNSDWIGYFGIVVGLCMMLWSEKDSYKVGRRINSISVNTFLVVSAITFFGFLASIEAMHFLFANGGPLMLTNLIADIAMLWLAFYVAKNSNTRY
jgi:holin